MNYEEMLKKARANMPESQDTERFEMPVADINIGKSTTIRNFSEIAKTLRRDGKHLAKFLFRELAVPGNINGNELVLQGKINRDVIRQRLEEYTKEFVLCHECGKPDTNITEEAKIITIKCEACGARKTGKKI
jgi:translation initiation factor 2 subunit 2